MQTVALTLKGQVKVEGLWTDVFFKYDFSVEDVPT